MLPTSPLVIGCPPKGKNDSKPFERGPQWGAPTSITFQSLSTTMHPMGCPKWSIWTALVYRKAPHGVPFLGFNDLRREGGFQEGTPWDAPCGLLKCWPLGPSRVHTQACVVWTTRSSYMLARPGSGLCGPLLGPIPKRVWSGPARPCE